MSAEEGASSESEIPDQYSSVEAYLAYMAKNIDPALAKFRKKDKTATDENESGDTETPVGENAGVDESDKHKETNEDTKGKDKSDGKYEGEDDCQEEIKQWLKQAIQWGKDNGFPDLETE